MTSISTYRSFYHFSTRKSFAFINFSFHMNFLATFSFVLWCAQAFGCTWNREERERGRVRRLGYFACLLNLFGSIMFQPTSNRLTSSHHFRSVLFHSLCISQFAWYVRVISSSGPALNHRYVWSHSSPYPFLCFWGIHRLVLTLFGAFVLYFCRCPGFTPNRQSQSIAQADSQCSIWLLYDKIFALHGVRRKA